MSDLTSKLQEAASAAIRDVAPAIEGGGPRLRALTVEVELDARGNVSGAVAWLQHRVNLGKLLGVGRG